MEGESDLLMYSKRMFNFGLIEIAEDGKLVASINDLNGVALYELVLDPR